MLTSFGEIEAAFASGGTRETAPMLFFVPDGAAWDAGYFDQLADSHCIVPIRIVYPLGYDGSSLVGVRMDCWDNNHPNDRATASSSSATSAARRASRTPPRDR